ncbi:COOH-NH2 ligase-type 2 [Vibrio phage 1.262.O._10N.286.51.A9]|nr:COOH-NH2 ligase-type 2 [Vibrio phage 1.262.O._10N.286.51.A9]
MTGIFGKVTLGSDPEIFITKDDGTPWGGLQTGITGTKENPQNTDYGAIQVDGMALEYNTVPTDSVEFWGHYHDKALEHINTCAKSIGCKHSKASLLYFDKYMDSVSTTEDETIFGCSPDHNADTMKENLMPDNDGSIKFRTTGGHVHIGLSKWSDLSSGVEHQLAQKVIYVCDLLLGVPSIKADKNGLPRRKLYGSAGAYRIKPYGVEYRTLSNFWVFDKAFQKYIFTSLTKVFSDDANFANVANIAIKYRNDIVEYINTGKIPHTTVCEEISKIIKDVGGYDEKVF